MTCVREDIPVTAVVFNNGQWGAEKKNQVDFYNNRFVGANLDKQTVVGRSRQGDGRRRRRRRQARRRRPGAAAQPSTAQMNDGKTTVLEMMCTRELGDPFRRDALSKPVRLLDKYKDYVHPSETAPSWITAAAPHRVCSHRRADPLLATPVKPSLPGRHHLMTISRSTSLHRQDGCGPATIESVIRLQRS